VVFRQRGTYDNTFLPACLGLSLTSALAYGTWAARSRPAESPRPWRATAVVITGCLLLTQFGLLAYNPIAQLPTQTARDAGDRLIARVRQLPGTVLFWDHSYYSAMAGKPTYVHGFMYADAAGWFSYPPRTPDHQRRRELAARTYTDALTRQLFDWIITDRPNDHRSPYYLYAGKLFDQPGIFYPVTGRSTQPESLLVKNPVARGGRVPLSDPTFNFLFDSGWEQAHARGRAVLAPQATIALDLERGRDYSLSIDYVLSCDDHAGAQTMTVAWNDVPLSSPTALSCRQQHAATLIPGGSIRARRNILELRFTTRGPLPLVTGVTLAALGGSQASGR